MTATATASERPSRRQPGWYIPWLFLPPFLVVCLANGFLIHYALSSFSGLTSQHASEEGAQYNAALAAARAQAERGWQVTMTVSHPHGLTATVEVLLHDRQGQPLTGADLTAAFIRPTRAGVDQAVSLAEQGNGRYRGEVTLSLPGIWDLRLIARHPAGTYQKTERITVAG